MLINHLHIGLALKKKPTTHFQHVQKHNTKKNNKSHKILLPRDIDLIIIAIPMTLLTQNSNPVFFLSVFFLLLFMTCL